MTKELKSKKVVVAMSGGIDSSVAAVLLKKQGFDVVGVFMKFWSEPAKNGICAKNRCCTPESEKRARLVAREIGIPFYVFNLEKEFKMKVVDYFLKQQKLGFTPNPCVVCNKEIKLGLLLKKALAFNADYVATGHYARITGGHKLLKGRDKNKDQSYVLWKLNQKTLSHLLFPVGGYTKDEVRKLAKKFNLPVLNIPESQEICFIQTTVNNFLSRYLKQRQGEIIDIKGNTLGEHNGLHFYTIGQRKGLNLPDGPFYVLDKDIRKNILIVTKDERGLYKKELIAKDINWISGKEPKLPLKIKAKIRYRHEPAPAVIKKVGRSKYKVIFSKPQRAITPGQSVVFYNSQEVLGGGIIA